MFIHNSFLGKLLATTGEHSVLESVQASEIIDLSSKDLSTKGQITSERNSCVLNFPRNQRNYLKDFCPSL